MNGQQGFVHEAWFYDDTDDYVHQLSAFVASATSSHEPVLLAVPADRHELLRSAFGDRADVTLADITDSGANPGRIIPQVLTAFMDDHPGQRTRVVGEPIWPGRSPEGYAAAVQHEALINVAFADRPATIVCPYDRSGLGARAIEDAACTHPHVRDGGDTRASLAYGDPVRTAHAAVGAPSPIPVGADSTRFFDLERVRTIIRREVARVALRRSRAADLKAAVTEVATNSLRHGGGSGVLSDWTEGRRLVVEIRDNGRIADPFVGRRLPTESNDVGRGLLITHALCDLVQVWSTRHGTTVRMWMQLEGAPG